ncbi:aldehyde dehydrogenase family protein [Sphingomonas sp. JC676]|uniref:aldehyde dehydrogenase family protein n=1 Tax=Sphingomonas sp. JC676 TaxID=2768065 RepID=UPI0016585F38|nr:aldehyde dehydrogenase family protein [Sphingomonas sp. JC676]MBC9031001.1 aldehyde dehydrogenase family protein [Sphingomonas sp. JC676]
MLEILEQQRAAHFSELPVPLAIRQDRLRRAVAMIEENSGALCAALCRDHAHQDQAAAMRMEITPALADLRNSLRNAAIWMRPEYGHGLWGRLARRGDYTEYQPVGVVGLAAPATLALRQTVSLLANALTAGDRIMVQFDSATPHLARLFAELSPRYFSSLELHILDGQAADAGAFAKLPFDMFVTGVPAEADLANGGAPNTGLSGATIQPSGKSPVIIGRSADLAKAAEQVIASKLVKSGHISLTPDYLLVPAEQEEAMASWLWRAAMHLRPRMAGHTEIDLPLSDAKLARFNRFIEDARARGAEILVAEPPDRRGQTGVQRMPLHIVRHATEDMLVMREEICGPILPLLGYGDIDEAISAIHRHKPPFAIYYFGRDGAERSHILARTISSAIALDGRSLAIAQAGIPQPAAGLNLATAHGEAGFHGFSRARRIYR